MTEDRRITSRSIILPVGFPNIVCLGGSSRFKKIFEEVGHKEEIAGNLILRMGFFSHADNVPVSDAEREILDRVDFCRIDLADEILVINPKTEICPTCNKPCKEVWR